MVGGPAGSSPLARGLPQVPSPVSRDVRIIPARAGFTTPRRREHPISPDHPRSRGVYAGHEISVSVAGGSSPLARGLRASGDAPERSARIIPARAGFTVGVVGHGPVRQDHPRSRGVYRAGLQPDPIFSGSSPLARGLPVRRRRRVGPGGIIPARAGFTLGRPGEAPRGADHPRSRGVYGRWPRSSRPAGGSSPLARGLHEERPPHAGVVGIIPARAGFTSSSAWGMTALRDHPRSRGVYPRRPYPTVPRSGSSPLARGLPRTT